MVRQPDGINIRHHDGKLIWQITKNSPSSKSVYGSHCSAPQELWSRGVALMAPGGNGHILCSEPELLDLDTATVLVWLGAWWLSILVYLCPFPIYAETSELWRVQPTSFWCIQAYSLLYHQEDWLVTNDTTTEHVGLASLDVAAGLSKHNSMSGLGFHYKVGKNSSTYLKSKLMFLGVWNVWTRTWTYI